MLRNVSTGYMQNFPAHFRSLRMKGGKMIELDKYPICYHFDQEIRYA